MSARARLPDTDDPVRQVREARRTFGTSIATAAAIAVSATPGVAVLIHTLPTRAPEASWIDSLPRLGLSDALTLITVFLVVFGLGVVRGPARARPAGPDAAGASMTDQQLREIAVVAGWAGTTVALWAVIDAVVSWQTDGASAGASAGRLLAAALAGGLMASLSALVPVRYPPEIQASVDAGRRANDRRIRAQLRAWGLSATEANRLRESAGARVTTLALPLLVQVAVPCAVITGYFLVRLPEGTAKAAALSVAALAVGSLVASAVVAPVAFYRAIPRAPIVGAASLLYLVMVLLLAAGIGLLAWGNLVAFTIWCAPSVVVGTRLGVSLIVGNRRPYVAQGLGALVDRRWWVLAFLEASEPARGVRPDDPLEPAPSPGYM